MDEQRKYAILFTATILAARKVSARISRAAAISEAIQKAEQILEMIDGRLPEVIPSESLGPKDS